MRQNIYLTFSQAGTCCFEVPVLRGRMLQPLSSVVVLLEPVEIIFDPVGLHHVKIKILTVATRRHLSFSN